jgi:phage baseplate assembly protein W
MLISKHDIPHIDDKASIKEHLRNLINLQKMEKPFHPEIYAGVEYFLFENFTFQHSLVMEKRIKNLISIYEPRVTVRSVSIDASQSNVVEVAIVYMINKSKEDDTLSIEFERTR